MNSIPNLKHSVLKKIVLIGSSTGGPGHIIKIIQKLPKLEATALVIGQHMVNGFLESFAKSLQQNGTNSVSIVQEDQALRNAEIYVCEGETKVQKKENELFFSYQPAKAHSYNPNINTLFDSFSHKADEYEIMAVILTGIGDDGVEACIHLSENRVRCLTETSESAIVDGMPSRARLLVVNVEVHDISDIVNMISEFCE
jgi:two-component system chemotaxis response regulator CheB